MNRVYDLDAQRAVPICQRDRFSAYLRSVNVIRRDSHWAARTCGQWQAVVVGADGWIRMFDLSADRQARHLQFRQAVAVIERRLRLAQGRGVTTAFMIRWKVDPES